MDNKRLMAIVLTMVGVLLLFLVGYINDWSLTTEPYSYVYVILALGFISMIVSILTSSKCVKEAEKASLSNEHLLAKYLKQHRISTCIYLFINVVIYLLVRGYFTNALTLASIFIVSVTVIHTALNVSVYPWKKAGASNFQFPNAFLAIHFLILFIYDCYFFLYDDTKFLMSVFVVSLVTWLLLKPMVGMYLGFANKAESADNASKELRSRLYVRMGICLVTIFLIYNFTELYTYAEDTVLMNYGYFYISGVLTSILMIVNFVYLLAMKHKNQPLKEAAKKMFFIDAFALLIAGGIAGVICCQLGYCLVKVSALIALFITIASAANAAVACYILSDEENGMVKSACDMSVMPLLIWFIFTYMMMLF